MPVHVALLRGINVGGGNKIPMAELRQVAGDLGWTKPETYIQSGNLLFEASGSGAKLETALEAAIKQRLGLEIPVIVRSAADWPAYVAANPFPEAGEAETNRLMLLLSKQPPKPDSALAIQERAKNGERVRIAAGAIWIHYPDGAGTSKLTSALIDRLVGSPATARNWRTIIKLSDMLDR